MATSSSRTSRPRPSRRLPAASRTLLLLAAASAIAAACTAATGTTGPSSTQTTTTAAPTTSAPPSEPPRAQFRLARREIEHVVFMVKENRTFDHLYGRFPGADGATEGVRCDGTVV